MTDSQIASKTVQTTQPPIEEPPDIWSVKVNGIDVNYGSVHEMIHRDIAIGNDYRKERIKLLTTLATGVFALTATFHKDLFAETLTGIGLALILLSWVLLIASLLAGIMHFRKWEDFYLEHRARGNAVWAYWLAKASANKDAEKRASEEYSRASKHIGALQDSYRTWNFIQSAGLLLGLAFIAGYVLLAGHQALSKLTPNNAGAPPALVAPATEKKE